MTRPLLASVALVLPMVLGACAAPYGGAPVVSAALETSAARGLVMHRPDILQDADKIRIHGDVCRDGARLSTAAVDIRVWHLDSSGRIVDEAATRLPTSLSPRNRTCEYYNVVAAWTVSPTDTIKVCADVAGHGSCASRASAD